MNGFNLNEEELLKKFGQTKQIEIERLLTQYGTSLKEVREMYPKLTEAISQRRLATTFPTEPLFFTQEEAQQMGLGLQEGWMLKLTPAKGNGGFTSSFITPQKWEITENDLYISPSGEQFSKADLEALLSIPTGGLEAAPRALTMEDLTEEGKALYREYQAGGGELGVKDWIDLRERQQLETEQVFGAVFPEQDISEVIDYIQRDPQGFITDIRDIGRTPETEALLRQIEFEDEQGNVRYLTEDEIDQIFGEVKEPVTPEYIPQSKIKDVWDAFIAGGVEFKQNIETFLFTNPPSPPSEEMPFPWATHITAIEPMFELEAAQSLYEYGLKNTISGYLRRKAENDDFWAEHPELAPRPEYLENPFDNPSLLKDPGYWGYSIASSAAYTLAVMGTMAGISAVATPVAGIPAAYALAVMPEAGSAIDELVGMGVPLKEAKDWGIRYGLAAGGIETASDIPLLGLVFKPLKPAIQPILNTIKKVALNNIARSILTGVAVTQTEAIEEVITQAVHNAILKHYDESQSILEGVSHAYIQATIASLPFGAIGGCASFRTFRANLSQETGQQYDKLVDRFQNAGLTKQEAQVQATNEIAKTDEGAVELEQAIEAAQEEYWETHPELTRPSMEPVVTPLPESILQDIKIAEEIGKVTPAIPGIRTGQPYTATVFRGYKPGEAPTDEGLFGKGTYYTTNREYAETYDGKEVVEVTLNNPFVINSQREAEDFWNEHTRPVREQAFNEGKTVEEADELAARAAREWLESQGYDGLIARNIIASGDEIVVFEPEKSVGAKIPEAEAGMPEAGLQPSMLEEVPAKEVRPQARGKLVQARLDDYLRLREYNEKATRDRIAEIKGLLEKKGRLPRDIGTKGNLRLELARLEALLELDAVDSVEDIDRLIRQVGEELGLRDIPYHGRAKNIFPGYTTRQLEEMLKVYEEARQTMSPEVPAMSPVRAQDIPIDIPALRDAQLTPRQIERTIELFKEAVAAPNTEQQRAAAIELRKHVFAQRAKNAKESAEAMIAEGMNPEEAIKASEQMFMSGKLPDVTTDYFNDLTQEMRNVLFGKVYNYWHDKPGGWTELISTFEALTNALAGKSIPRVRGIGTKYFPDGGSAWDRLVRVFIGEPEVLEALDKQLPLLKIIEGIYLETGRGSVSLNQDTVNWLKELATISEEDRILLEKPLSEINETDFRRIAQAWFYERRNELNTLFKDGVITDQEYKIELALAKDKVFPYKPIGPVVAYPTKVVGQPRLGEEYIPLEALAEARTEEELRRRREVMESAKELAEARAKREREPFQPVVIDPELNDELSKQLPLLTLREKGTIIRTLKNIGLTIVDIGNLVRANKASFDFSFWRQARALALGHPVAFYRANIDAWKAMWSQEEAEAQWQRITRDPDYELYEQIRLDTGADPLRILESPKGTAQWRAAEEMGYLTGERAIPRFTARIPWIKVSGRAYVGGCNSLVWSVWKKCLQATRARAMRIASGDIKLEEGEGFSISEEMVDYQKYIADAIQRASLGKAAPLAPALGSMFFAPRSKLARLLYPRHLVSSNPRVRALAWKDFSLFIGSMSGLVMLGWWLGLWNVERDPRNAEFMSIRIGNMRIDPWAGYRQFVVLYARLITGTGISSVTGQEYEVNPIGALTTFFRTSLSPLSSILLDFWTGKNFLGEELDIADPEQWLERIAPFAIQDVWEAFQDNWQNGLIAILPAIVGEGVQTYTGDWLDNWGKLGLPKYPENTGYGIDEPVYDLADFWNDTASQFRGVDPATLTASKGYPEYIRSIAQALQIIEEVNLLPNKRLASINADPEEGLTFKDYYEMWQMRQGLVNAGDDARFTVNELQHDGTYREITYKGEEAVEAFDKDENYRYAYLGNMKQSQYALLVEYHSLPDDLKADFLGNHPEIYVNLRKEWLRTHVDENALLALWLDPDTHGIEANVYSLEALDKIETLAKSIGIPDSAMFDREIEEVTKLKIKHSHLFDLLDVYSGLDDTVKDDEGLTAHDRAIQELYEQYPDFRDDMRRIEALSQGTEEETTPDEIVELWVDRGRIVDEYGANSAEAKLWLIDNQEAHQWALDKALLTDDGSDWNETILRLLVQYRDDFDMYDAYGDMSSDNYIEDDEQRAEARRNLIFDEQDNLTDFGKAYYIREASSQGYSEDNWNSFVEYSQLPIWGSWRERFLVDNPAFYKEYTDENIGAHSLIDELKIKPLARDRIYQQFYDEFVAWDDTAGMAPKRIENMRVELNTIEKGGMTFGEARYRVQAYDKGVPEKYIDLYVEYYELPDAGYEQEWFFMDHVDYYRDVWLGILENQPKDFYAIPTREVWNLYQTYKSLPSGQPRLDFRAEHIELDDWLVLKFGYKPIEDRGNPEAESTPWEELAEVRQFKELFN